MRRSSSAFPRARPSGRTQEVAATRSSIISCTGRDKKNVTPSSPSPAAAAAARPARIPARRFINLAPFDERKGNENSAQADRRPRLRRIPRSSRCSGVRAGSRRNPRPRPVGGLHDGAAEHERHEPRAVRRCARSACSPQRMRIQCWRRFGSASCRTSPASKSISTSSGSPRSASTPTRRELDALDGVGRPIRQRLHRPRAASSASMSRAMHHIARLPPTLASWFVRNNQGAMVPFSSFATTSWTTAPTTLEPLRGLSVLRDSGPGRARRKLRPGDGARSKSWRRKSRASASPGPAHPTRNGSPRARRRCSTPSR